MDDDEDACASTGEDGPAAAEATVLAENRRLARENADLRARLNAARVAELEAVYATMPVGVALVSDGMRFLCVNDMVSLIDGVPKDAYVGRHVSDVVPEIAPRVLPIYREVLDTGVARRGVPIEATLPATGDAVRSFVADFYPVALPADARALGICVREVTEERRLVEALSESQTRMRALFDASPILIVMTEGPEHRYVYANPAIRKRARRDFVGRTVAEAFPELVDQNVVERFDRVFETGEKVVVPEFEATIEVGGAKHHAWYSQEIQPIRDPEGRVNGTISYATEISDLVRARLAAQESEAQKTLLMAELQHRVKNSLATVRAVSRLLTAGARDAATLRDRLDARLVAMSRAHDMLTQTSWGETGLQAILAQASAPFESRSGDRVRVAGDEVPLDPKTALAFAMAFHELMTNAAKYGALSVEAGWIDVETRAGDEGGRRMVWKERGGPPVVDPQDRKGFGSIVIERVLASDARAEIDVAYEPDGLRFEARF